VAARGKGKMERAKGNVKEAAGKLAGDRRMVAKGKAQQSKGSTREAAKKMKDALTQ
jgi:uncharacterized protein YjbJ (UPF0337 family)